VASLVTRSKQQPEAALQPRDGTARAQSVAPAPPLLLPFLLGLQACLGVALLLLEAKLLVALAPLRFPPSGARVEDRLFLLACARVR
jgi:hypothetical protein